MNNKMTLYFCCVTDICVGLQYGQNGDQEWLAGSSKTLPVGGCYEVPENIHPLGLTAEQLVPYAIAAA